MGEVWKARDSRLGREVAIKILPAEFAADAQLRERFEREAKAISRLNHPHICTLYDVGEGYLVMELLEGESLADRLDRGPLPVEDVLRYGAQIASALDRAHRAGIVHRDLKPGNVMITKQGAKLLDFGLAKSARIQVRGDDATQQKPLTEEGTIVGTFQYMAPEQLEGQDVDHRTDIFALGATLYEMTTGRPAFEGDTRVSLIAAIMTTRPRPVTPPALEHVIAKCLNRDPEERWQSAHDVAEDLKWIATAAPPAVPARKRSRELIWIVALLAAIAVAAWLALRQRPRGDAIATSITTDGNSGPRAASGPPVFSPDGKWLLYSAADAAGQPMLWLRSMDRDTTQPLSGTNGGFVPFWSPDGRFIGFSSANGDLKKIAVGSGEVETIAKNGNGWSWNRDGTILLVGSFLKSVYRVSASGGGAAEVLPAASIGANTVGWPTFLPDGNHFLFAAFGGLVERRGQSGLWVATLDHSEKPRFLTRASSHAVYVEPGYLLFARAGVLRAQRFHPGTLQMSGDDVAIAPVQNVEFSVGSAALFSASSSGLLIYQPPERSFLSELLLKNRKGETLRKIGDLAFHAAPRVSPDGRRIAVDLSGEKLNGDIWILGAGDGAASRFSFEKGNETTPVWSPRGDEIAYVLHLGPDGNGGSSILRKRIGDRPQPVIQLPGRALLWDWSADGRHLALDRWPTLGGGDALVWSFAERKLVEVAASPAVEAHPVFSPDGKWIAYQSDESGRFEIYVQPFPPTGAKYQASVAGGTVPRWSRDGEIAYADLSHRINVIKVETAPLFRSGRPEALFSIQRPERQAFVDYDFTPDGNFLVNTPARDQPQPMKLLVNWTRRLEGAK